MSSVAPVDDMASPNFERVELTLVIHPCADLNRQATGQAAYITKSIDCNPTA
ncbi:hypothetical protein [Methylobacterium komagatae]